MRKHMMWLMRGLVLGIALTLIIILPITIPVSHGGNFETFLDLGDSPTIYGGLELKATFLTTIYLGGNWLLNLLWHVFR